MRDEERQALEALMAEDPAIAALAETGRKLPPPEARARQAVPPPQALPASTPPPPEPPKLEFYSAASLYGRTIERPPIIINNLIPAGLTVLAGAPKRGKSWMALKMALCIASGEPFLGMATSKGAVLYLDLESKAYRVQDRLSKLIVGPAPENLYFAHKSERLDAGLMEQLKAWASQVEHPSMIIIDTLGRVKSGSRKGENAYESDTRIFGDLQAFAMENKLSVVAVHHLRKDTGNNDDYFERISGSMGLTGVCDAVMALAGKRGEETSILKTSSRDFEAQDFVVRFNGGAWELVSCDSASYQDEQAYRNSAVVRGVIAVAEKYGQWQGTVSDLQTTACEVSDTPIVMMRSSEFGKELQRFVEPLLQKNDVRISMRRIGKNRSRVLTVEKVGQNPQTLMDFTPVPNDDVPF